MDVAEGKLTVNAEDFDLAFADMPQAHRQRASLRLFGALSLLCGLLSPEPTSHGWLVLGVGLLAYAQFRRPAHGKKLMASMNEEERAVSYRFDAQGVALTTPKTSVALQYSALHRQFDGRTAFILCPQERAALVVPKRAFSADEVARIRAWLVAGVPAKPADRSWLRIVGVVVLLYVAIFVGQLFFSPNASSVPQRESKGPGSHSTSPAGASGH